MQRALDRSAARRDLLNVPEGLKGGDAEAWTQQKLVELAPLAAAEMEYQLVYGDDDQRMRAAIRVHDSTGHGKKELNAGGATIIINATGGVNIPWRSKPEKTVDGGKVVEVHPIGALQSGEKAVK